MCKNLCLPLHSNVVTVSTSIKKRQIHKYFRVLISVAEAEKFSRESIYIPSNTSRYSIKVRMIYMTLNHPNALFS